jgi:replicative DNA helicase
MQALRSSGQLEQDADIVMLLYREEPGILRSRRILTVAKNKEGQTGSWPLRFEGDIQTFQVDKTGKPIKRAEPEKEEKQQAFWPIPGSEPLPWDEGRE